MSLSGSLGGAVDLAALKKDTVDTTSGGMASHPNGESVPGPYILSITSANLQGTLTISEKLPVILVFHSAKSANSATLVANLEKLANTGRGRFQLGKVNVDDQADIAQAFGVNAVPAAAALLQGNPVPLFQGLPEESQMIDTIDQVVEAAAQYGLTGVLDGDTEATPPEPEIPPLHKEGMSALENGDLEGAHAAYTKALAQNPSDDEAQVAIYQVELLQRISKINPDGDISAVQAKLVAAQGAPLTDIETQLEVADIEFSLQHPDAAFNRLIEVVRNTSGEDRDRARERLLAYFEILGPTVDLVIQARKALTNALF